MKTNVLLLSIIAVIASFAGGFLLANALNRNEFNNLKAENGRLQSSQTDGRNGDSGNTLTNEEIARKIDEADRNSDDFTFQKGLGLGLYRYAAVKQDTKLFAQAARLLERAAKLNPQDYDVIVALGNLYFDVGYYKKNNEELLTAREFYQKALEQKPNDVDVRTDLGLTYFLLNPPEIEQAIAEFQKSLRINSKHEKSLQVLTQALLKQNKANEAEKYLAILKSVNQNNETLPELSAQLAQSKNELEKQ